MRFYHSGQPYNTPEEIRTLPFDSLRSHEYPRDPAEAESAIAQQGSVVPSYLPSRMANTRWKTPPYQQAWGTNVVSLMQALRANYELHQQLRSTYGQVPISPLYATAATLNANRLPQPTDNTAADMNQLPLGTDVLPDDRIAVRASDLQAFSKASQDQLLARNAVQTVKLKNAMDSAAQSAVAINAILGR